MNSKARLFIVSVTVGVGLLMPLNRAFADSASVKQLSAEWWQWALSIPPAESPQLDTTGEDCVVGQRGEVWFLAGTFGGGTVTRTCSIPEGTVLFFPVANSVFIDTPNVCGQNSESIPIEEMRAAAAAFIDGVTNIAVEVDGEPIGNVPRVQSQVLGSLRLAVMTTRYCGEGGE